MKKRVRLNDLQLGMYVEDTEGNNSDPSSKRNCFPILSSADIDYLIKSNLLSVVVNTSRARHGGSYIRSGGVAAALLNDLKAKFSPAEVAAAQKTISVITPHIRQVLSDIRNGRDIVFSLVDDTIDQVFAAVQSNADAFLTLLRLKRSDNGTFLHSISVSALMVTFARSLNLEAEIIRQLGVAGLVHDFGKMRLPTTILQKTGKLTADEIEIIQTHPAQGFGILQKIPEIHYIARDVTLYHHEKFDGSGYPTKLSGENIPKVARIAAICDVYDALTTVRPYKRAWSQNEAIDLMLRSRGHFDPTLLEAFVSGVVVNSKPGKGTHG